MQQRSGQQNGIQAKWYAWRVFTNPVLVIVQDGEREITETAPRFMAPHSFDCHNFISSIWLCLNWLSVIFLLRFMWWFFFLFVAPNGTSSWSHYNVPYFQTDLHIHIIFLYSFFLSFFFVVVVISILLRYFDLDEICTKRFVSPYNRVDYILYILCKMFAYVCAMIVNECCCALLLS